MTRETSIESKQESLRAVLYVFVAHQLMNAIVLGPWNSMRCLYWYVISCNGAAHVHRIELTRERERERHDVLRCVLFCFVLLCFLFATDQLRLIVRRYHHCFFLETLCRNQTKCSPDEGWICNWFAFGHFHVAVVLAGMMVGATPDLEEKLSNLCCAIIMAYLAEGIFAIDQLDRYMAMLQVLSYVGMLCAIFYYTYQDPAKPYLLLSPAMKFKSSSSFDQRNKLPISTLALFVHLISSIVQLLDMTIGKGQEGYVGDMSR